jgi:membrane protein DedA with SNARE-associated domain
MPVAHDVMIAAIMHANTIHLRIQFYRATPSTSHEKEITLIVRYNWDDSPLVVDMLSIEQITGFIFNHSSYAGPAVFIVSLFGALPGTNLLVPAGAILTATGVLVGANLVSWNIGIWAAAGAIFGMTGSYYAGQNLGKQIRNFKIFKAGPNVMVRAENLFARFGLVSILIAYFSGPLRAPIACVAAIAGMSLTKFTFANAIAGTLWAIVAIGMGAASASIIKSETQDLGTTAAMVAAIALACSAAILFGRKWLNR